MLPRTAKLITFDSVYKFRRCKEWLLLSMKLQLNWIFKIRTMLGYPVNLLLQHFWITALTHAKKSSGCDLFRLNCMRTLITQTWRQTHTDTQINTTVLLTWVLLSFQQAGASNYPCGLQVWALLLLILLLLPLKAFSHLSHLHLAIFPTNRAPNVWTIFCMVPRHLELLSLKSNKIFPQRPDFAFDNFMHTVRGKSEHALQLGMSNEWLPLLVRGNRATLPPPGNNV